MGVVRQVEPDMTAGAALVPFCECISLITKVIAKSSDPGVIDVVLPCLMYFSSPGSSMVKLPCLPMI